MVMNILALIFVIITSTITILNKANAVDGLAYKYEGSSWNYKTKHGICTTEDPLKLIRTHFPKNVCLPSHRARSNISEPRFLFYDVNPGEGFNLRRDVYLRVATLLHKLNKHQPWVMVLPPWGNLYHWKNENRSKFYPWNLFFNLDSFRKFIPVIELEDYIKENGHFIDASYVLQHYAEGWGEKYEEKYDVRSCIDENSFRQVTDKIWSFIKWSKRIQSTNFSCLSFQGQASTIIPFLKNATEELDKRSVFLDRAETLLHDEFGGVQYWAARRSMKFAIALIEEGNEFRKKYLSSDDDKDKTKKMTDWKDFKPKRAKSGSIGGPYLAVHLRRRDFLYARREEVPDIRSAADQLMKLLQKHSLNVLFVATDAPKYEVDELRSHLAGFEVYTFKPSVPFYKKYGDGGAAIVDQIICSHARYFIGTFESTFSFRIQEEREILGFALEDTFNRLCGNNSKCEQPTKWTIVY